MHDETGVVAAPGMELNTRNKRLVCITAFWGSLKLQTSVGKPMVKMAGLWLFRHHSTQYLADLEHVAIYSYANLPCGFAKPFLIFVRRGVDYCDAVAIPLPSLGVSSLDLGRLQPRAVLFFWARFVVIAMTGGEVGASAYSAAAAR
jgi:hypothetical protein